MHVIGPELGLTLPGKTIVCGNSHTSTHGAFGALAFGVGTSEVEHVLATQCLWQEGRQGRGARTHLVSPMMAAAAAIAGRFVDVRDVLDGAVGTVNEGGDGNGTANFA